ncbi:MAG TPA: trypsin-like peptidase domain-containing protein [Ilumatobacteraceae bacterium]|jgi:putative serine protease PepD
MAAPLPPPQHGDPFVPMPPPAPRANGLTEAPLSRWKRPVKHPQVFVILGVVVAVWCAGLVGVLVGLRIDGRHDSTRYTVSTQPVAVAKPRGAAFDSRIDVAAVTAALRPSVVTVSTDISEKGQFGEGVGTGIILTSDGQIITNAHVVNGATKVRVRLDGESEPRPAAVVAIDAANDLALLQIDVTGLHPATLADPNSAEVGDDVVAIGFALNLDGEPSVTLGIISALSRTLVTDDGALNGLIQTDAAISSGNSGGPLVDAAGHVVGINTAVAKGDATNTASNIGFAISIQQVLPELKVLRAQAAGQTRSAGFLGVGLRDRTDGGQGAVVNDVSAGSPAAAAGIEDGDVIVKVDGAAVDGTGGVIGAIRDHQAGDTAQITIDRNGAEKTVTVTLTDRPTTTTTG